MECMDHGSLYDLLHNDTVGGVAQFDERSSQFTMPRVISPVQPQFLLFNPAMLVMKFMEHGSLYQFLHNDPVQNPDTDRAPYNTTSARDYAKSLRL